MSLLGHRLLSNDDRISNSVVCVNENIASQIDGSRPSDNPIKPTFDVANITPNKSGGQSGSSRLTVDSYIGENITLKRMFGLSYSPVQEFEGGPGWIDSEHYAIRAKAESRVADADGQDVSGLED